MKRLFTTLFIALIAFGAQAEAVKVKFKVLDADGNAMKGATVKLFKLNKLVMVDQEASSTTKWELEKDSYYTIEVSMSGFVTKRIGIYTQVDEDKLEENKYDFFVELESVQRYREYKNPEYVLDYPSAILEFKESEGTFGFNENYWKSTRKDYAALRASVHQSDF